MCDKPWEALAEVTLYLNDDDSGIYCLCSRAFIRNDADLTQENENVCGTPDEDVVDSELIAKHSDLPVIPLVRKNELEAVSCYCSASHYSTDDYESAAHPHQNSDSGADLSEHLADRVWTSNSDEFTKTSLDVAWERHWADNGEALIWQSWIDRYGAYINQTFVEGGDVIKVEEDAEAITIPDVKITCLEEIEIEKLLKSDSFGSGSGFERGRRVRSRCSNSSAANTTITTDSMTNVTKITLSSLDLSCDSNSLISSSSTSDPSSGPSSESSHEENSPDNDARWRKIWKEHYDELFSESYRKFCEEYKNRESEVTDTKQQSSDDERALEKAKVQLIKKFCWDHTESADSSIDENVLAKRFGELNQESEIGDTRAKQLRKFGARERRQNSFRSWSYVNSVGYILQRINDGGSNDQQTQSSSTVDGGDDNNADSEKEEGNGKPPDSSTPKATEKIPVNTQCCYPGEGDNESDEDEEDCPRRLLKRKSAHEADVQSKPLLDRVKAAMGVMTLPFQPTLEEPIVRGNVHYRKRNIRAQNRRLRINEPRQRVHLFFDDDGNVERNESALIPSPATPAIEPEALGYEAHSSSLEDCSEADAGNDGGKKQKKRKRKQRKSSTNSNLPIEIMENKNLLKYWLRRHQLFLKYDDGVRLDAESWFSVTPEKVAMHQAERCRCDLIVDAFCGAGGNAIQFASTCERVIAIDIDPLKIEIARHNAEIYGVADRIEFIVGDFAILAPTLKADVIFLSPPWGGPKYMRASAFPLAALCSPIGGEELFRLASLVSPLIAIFLPRNINTYEVTLLCGSGSSVEFEQDFLDSKLIGVTAYFNDLILDPDMETETTED